MHSPLLGVTRQEAMRPLAKLLWTFIMIIIIMSQYSVPEDLEITNKEKKNYNGCNGIAGSERALK